MAALLIGYARCSTDQQDLTAVAGVAAALYLDPGEQCMDASGRYPRGRPACGSLTARDEGPVGMASSLSPRKALMQR
jgi:hypothetical protein